jgi:UPF0716 protein FxsA
MNISRPFLLLLAILPFIEIALLVRVVGLIGFVPTLGLLLIAGFAGMAIIRRQGMTALLRAQQNLARGELPTRDIVDSGIVVLGGVLLIVPGVLSDLMALPCLIPTLRNRLAVRLIVKLCGVEGPGSHPSRDSVIEGEFRRED